MNPSQEEVENGAFPIAPVIRQLQAYWYRPNDDEFYTEKIGENSKQAKQISSLLNCPKMAVEFLSDWAAHCKFPVIYINPSTKIDWINRHGEGGDLKQISGLKERLKIRYNGTANSCGFKFNPAINLYQRVFQFI